MNNLLKRLKKREGFTLVECIVAIAVFAVMVMLVFMILTNARNEAVNANKSEEDLTKLIDNVVSDETYKKFNSSNINNLHLEIGGASTGSFDITYNVIDGYKNFVICDNVPDPSTGIVCNYFADNSDFMGTTLPTAFAQTPYTCPKCSGSVVQQLICEDCQATGDHTDTSLFVYLPENGGYGCLGCGGTTVRGTNIDDFVDSHAKLSVSGLVPNAITYGQVEQQTTPEGLFTCTGGTPGSNIVNLTLKYEENASGNNSIAGTYTLDIVVPSGVSEVAIKMPPFYKFSNFVNHYPSTVPCTVTDGIDYTSDGRPIGQDGYIKFDTSAGGLTGRISFQLVNYKSGFSFEYDYYDSDTSKTGLSKYWFGMNGTISTDPTTGYVEDYTCNRQYTVA